MHVLYICPRCLAQVFKVTYYKMGQVFLDRKYVRQFWREKNFFFYRNSYWFLCHGDCGGRGSGPLQEIPQLIIDPPNGACSTKPVCMCDVVCTPCTWFFNQMVSRQPYSRGDILYYVYTHNLYIHLESASNLIRSSSYLELLYY